MNKMVYRIFAGYQVKVFLLSLNDHLKNEPGKSHGDLDLWLTFDFVRLLEM